MTRTRFARLFGVVVLVTAAGTLPAGALPAAAAAAAAAKTVRIVIKPNGVLNGFTPEKLKIARGTVVVVQNKDSMSHTMTSRAKDARGNPLFSQALPAHRSTTVKGVAALAAGSYAFYCAIHPNMTGTLIVTGKPGGTKAATTTFTQPLVVPRTLTASNIKIPVESAKVRVMPTGYKTRMWTFGGTYPGPTVRRTGGHATTVTYHDELPRSSGPLSIHLHGDHHSSADDGQPTMTAGGQTNILLPPGGTRTYHYDLTDAGGPERDHFDFYHDHTMGETARNNWNGLQGMFIVDSPAEMSLGLPRGAYDVPLMVSDRSLHGHNKLNRLTSGPPPNDATVGTHILVNGRYAPYLKVAAHRYRLRLLNSSVYQSYDFALSNGRSFEQVGTGDGLLPHPVRRSDILLGPAQRADVVVDFAGEVGHRVVLRSIPSTDKAPGAVGTPSAPIMQFRVTHRAHDSSKVPKNLEPVPALTIPHTSSETWAFGLGGTASSGMHWTVNGQAYDPSRVDHVVTEGTTQMWTLKNDTDVTHYIHLHEEDWHTVARIDANGVRHTPPPWEQGLEDTWRIDPHAAVEVAATFTDYPGVFMIHCHMLNHEDDGMMAQFAVVAPDNPMLPAGFHYVPLSGEQAPLGGTQNTAMSSGSTAMPGMTATGATHRSPRSRTHPVAAAPLPLAAAPLPLAATPLPIAAAPAAWQRAATQFVRSVGVEIVIVAVIFALVWLRRRTRSG